MIASFSAKSWKCSTIFLANFWFCLPNAFKRSSNDMAFHTTLPPTFTMVLFLHFFPAVMTNSLQSMLFKEKEDNRSAQPIWPQRACPIDCISLLWWATSLSYFICLCCCALVFALSLASLYFNSVCSWCWRFNCWYLLGFATALGVVVVVVLAIFAGAALVNAAVAIVPSRLSFLPTVLLMLPMLPLPLELPLLPALLLLLPPHRSSPSKSNVLPP